MKVALLIMCLALTIISSSCSPAGTAEAIVAGDRGMTNAAYLKTKAGETAYSSAIVKDGMAASSAVINESTFDYYQVTALDMQRVETDSFK